GARQLAAVELADLRARRDRAGDAIVATGLDRRDLGAQPVELGAMCVGLDVARLVALGEQRVARGAEPLVHGVGIAARHVTDVLPLTLQILDRADRLAPAAVAGRAVRDLLRTRDQRLL